MDKNQAVLEKNLQKESSPNEENLNSPKKKPNYLPSVPPKPFVLLPGAKAPRIKAYASFPNGDVRLLTRLDDTFVGKWIILVFYPKDWTNVCPTEIRGFSNAVNEWKQLGTEIIFCSTDSQFSHAAWTQYPKSEGGLGPVNYPLLSDSNFEISRSYGVLNEADGSSMRGLFVIDNNGIIRHSLINHEDVARKVDDILRVLKSLKGID